jgi:hypothetical protein
MELKTPAKFLKPSFPLKTTLNNLKMEVVTGKEIGIVKHALQTYHYLPRHNLVGRQIYIIAYDTFPNDLVAVLVFF